LLQSRASLTYIKISLKIERPYYCISYSVLGEGAVLSTFDEALTGHWSNAPLVVIGRKLSFEHSWRGNILNVVNTVYKYVYFCRKIVSQQQKLKSQTFKLGSRIGLTMGYP